VQMRSEIYAKRWVSRAAVVLLCALACTSALAQSAVKSLRLAMSAAESTFDPAAIDDVPSNDVARLIFDPPLEFEFHARPIKLKPATLDALPTVSADGRSYTMSVKPGIYFSDDPAFGGKKRELTAADYVYSIKRLADPKIASPNYYLIENKIIGMKPVREAAEKSGKFDYDREVTGLKALDRYRFQIVFEQPDFEFIYNLSTTSFAAVAREVIEKYRDERGRVREHPIGTGAFILAKNEWKRSSKVALVRNPNYREEYLPLVGGGVSKTRVPALDRIEMSVIEEDLPRVLAFQSGELDVLNIPRAMLDKMLDGSGKLKQEHATRGVRHVRMLDPALNFNYFNMNDPTVGGTSVEKNALRRAILMGYDYRREIEVIFKGQAEPAQQLVPPTQFGHSAILKLRPPYDPQLARALLDRFGYKDCDGDGFRELPGCKPLVFTRSSPPDSRSRDQDEIWKKSMSAIGIRVEFFKQKWPDLIEMSRTGKLQSWGWGWIASGPSGDGFLSLLVSRNINAINDMQFNDKEYDRLYDLAQTKAPGSERDRLYVAMSRVAAANTVMDFGIHTYSNEVSQPWLTNYARHPFWRTPWKYVDIDVSKR
jgi:oligopeptide transport system substrate-binding protein